MSFMKQLDFFGEGALDAIRSNWRTTIENEGGRCPCCDRWGKINAVSLTENMALSLLWLSRQPVNDQGFVKVPDTAPLWIAKSRTYPALQHWGLIVKVDKTEDKTKKSEGLWQVTTKGIAFLKNQISIPKKCFVYDKGIEGFSAEEIFFCDAFGKHFVYAEVMSDTFNLNNIKE